MHPVQPGNTSRTSHSATNTKVGGGAIQHRATVNYRNHTHSTSIPYVGLNPL